jgi:site-specific recombinase
LETLWCTVLRLIGHKEGKKGFGKVVKFLEDSDKSDLARRLKDIDENMMNRRHLPVHYSRVFITWHQGEMYVPLNVEEEMLWSQGYETIEWRRSDRQLYSDLVQAEKLVNELHEALIRAYGSFVADKNIVVNRGGKRE